MSGDAPWSASRRATRDLGRCVGWIGLDVPLELIEAAGFTPLAILADPSAPDPAGHPYAEGRGHPLVHALAAELIALSRAGLRRVVIGAAPASNLSLHGFLQGLKRLGAAPDLDIHLAEVIHLDTPSARAFNAAALERLTAALGGASSDRLAQAIAERNRLRAALRAVDRRRLDPHAPISGMQALALHATASEGAAAKGLERLAEGLQSAFQTAGGRPLLFSGQVATAWRAYPVLEAHGWRVVAEDCDLGARGVGPDVATDGAPETALVERYRARTPTADGWSTAHACRALLDLVQATGAQAVVLDAPAFDHPPAWDYPAKRAALQAAGVGCVQLDPYAYRAPEAAALAAVEALASLQRPSELAHG